MSILKSIAGAAAVITLALPVQAQTDPMKVAAFLEIIANNGCSMTEGEAENIFPASGFDKAETRAIATELIGSGVVAFSDGSLVIIDGSCVTSTSLNSFQQNFIDILALNGCQMTEDDAKYIFPENGMESDLAFEIAEGLIDSGIATLSEDRNVISVGSDYCTPADGGDDPTTALLANPDVQQFIDIMSFNGCAVREEDVPVVFPSAGMSADLAFDVGERLISANIATFTETDGLVVHEPTCMAATDISLSEDEDLLKDPDIQRFVEIMANNGCRMVEDDVRTIYPAAGMSADLAFELGEKLVIDGYGYFTTDDELFLLNAYCIPTAEQIIEATTDIATVETDDSAEALFVAVMLQNGCVITELDAREAFPAAGLAMEDVYDIVDGFIANDMGSISGDDTTLTLNVPDCTIMDNGQENVADETPVQPVQNDISDDPANPEAAFLTLMAANGCEITQANARDVFNAAGMDFNVGMGIAARMLNDGRATSPDGGQILQIPAPLCVAGGSAGPMEPRDIFIEVLRGNNCTMTATDFGVLFPVDGLDQNTAFGLVADLEAEGIVTLPATRDAVTLSAELCQ